MIQIPKEQWTWGKIKEEIERKGFINNDTLIWYIDINVEKADRDIIINTGEKLGAEITNHPEI
jgi:hypothetical protein